jgi:hypothetical protein
MGTTTTMKTALPGRFVSIYSRLVGNIGEAYTVIANPFDPMGFSMGIVQGWAAFLKSPMERANAG